MRLDRMLDDPARKIQFLGKSSIGELAGQLFAEEYSLLNEASRYAAEALDLLVEEEPSDFGEQFEWFARQVTPFLVEYEAAIGRRLPEVPLRLEVDKLFDWLAHVHRPRIETEANERQTLDLTGRA